ncbi:MAG: hypothetical protein ACI85O_002500 [Saprospiraceae bacterium]|jgi:hypothetical protein
MTPTKLLTFCALFFLFFATSCEDEMPIVELPEEVITTLTYDLVSEDGSDTVTLTFKDLDGDGGNDPEITGGALQSNTTYNGQITLLNESETPSEDITEEVAEEDDEHQLFFSSTGDLVAVTYEDVDENSAPVGLVTKLTTTVTGSTDLKITLRHQPTKDGENVAAGDITNAGGSTDIEVTFPVTVQ